MSEVITTAPRLAVRKEAVDAPELGGAVVVRGLLLSEAFAVQAYRAQALRRLRQQAASAAQPQPSAGPEDPGLGLPPGASAAAAEDADGALDTLTVPELQLYGTYVAHLLHYAVSGARGTPLYGVDQWEVAYQHHPDLVRRLQAVAERLSGFDSEGVEKN